ncbi:MAG: helix-turn-helix domain-containing protein [Elusimicrobiaceae bacterium]|nr:helix-turn-helix domain-containing protein [Elusimicrobiaceae bacterium]
MAKSNFLQNVEEIGVVVEREMHRFAVYDVDFSFPYVILTLCLGGSARALFDMREITQRKNDLGIILPDHVMRPLECSEDYTYARIAVSQKMFDNLNSQLFSHDYEKFHYAPVCSLTDEQAHRILSIMELIGTIAAHDPSELKHRDVMLQAQIAVGYEFLNYYRREQDLHWSESRSHVIFAEFCDLVVAHFREAKEILYYADKLHLHPKYLSRVISTETHGISPKEWIANYVVAQAKALIASNPTWSLKEVAYDLGFEEPTSFYRYFKRVAGITANEYKETLNTK